MASHFHFLRYIASFVDQATMYPAWSPALYLDEMNCSVGQAMDSMDLYIQKSILGFVTSPHTLSSGHQHGKRMPWSPGQKTFLHARSSLPWSVIGRLVLFGTPTASKRRFRWTLRSTKDPNRSRHELTHTASHHSATLLFVRGMGGEKVH